MGYVQPGDRCNSAGRCITERRSAEQNLDEQVVELLEYELPS